MTRPQEPGGMRIGEILKRARTRQGLDMRTVEERTKIRIKYLRALEGEDWDLLPSSAYAKGFLRTYAQMLGLDGDALVDEYRRQVESDVSAEQPYPLTEPVLKGRRTRGGAGPPWGLIGAVAGGVIALLLVLAIAGGDDDGEGRGQRAAKQERQREDRQERREREQRRAAAETGAEPVTLRLAINSGVTVCLIGDAGQPLVDDQLLSPGTEEGPYEASRFELRFPAGYDRGQFDLFLGGKPKRLPELSGPAAFRIQPPRRVRQVEAPAEGCP